MASDPQDRFSHATNAIDVSPLVARVIESVHKEIRNAIRIR